MHDASVDFGYASAFATASQKALSTSRLQQTNINFMTTPDDRDDAETVCSDGSLSVDEADLADYKAELVDDLASKVRKLDASPDALERMFAALPSLMRSFALKLGQPGSIQAERDVMYFVHKYRV